MTQTIISASSDLSRGVQHTPLRTPLVAEDKHAHVFRIVCTRNGTAVDMAGASISAIFARADGVTVTMTGSVEDGNAVVTLDEACYRVGGRFAMAIKATTGDVVATIYLTDGYVDKVGTDTIISSEEVTLSLEELFSRLTVAESMASTAAQQATASQEAAAAAQASAEAAAEVSAGAADATIAANNAANRANAAADRLEGVDVSQLENAVADLEEDVNSVQAAVTPTTLWSGTWTSGNVTIASIGEWRLLQITTSVGAILAVNAGTLIQAFGLSLNTDLHRTIGVRIEIADGGSCTLVAAHHLKHNDNGSHASLTSIEVRAVIGLIKN